MKYQCENTSFPYLKYEKLQNWKKYEGCIAMFDQKIKIISVFHNLEYLDLS